MFVLYIVNNSVHLEECVFARFLHENKMFEIQYFDGKQAKIRLIDLDNCLGIFSNEQMAFDYFNKLAKNLNCSVLRC